MQNDWAPPDRLGFSSMRAVRLSGQGMFLVGMAVFLVLGGIALGIFLAGKVRRETEQQRLLADQGITANAVIARHWRTGGKSSTDRVQYRFEYQGTVYTGNVRVPAKIWRGLTAGQTLQVRFVPSQPAISHPVGWESRPLPLWFPYLIAGMLAVLGFILWLVISRQMRLLAEGRPVPGRVTAVGRGRHGTVVRYEFQTLNGATMKGRSETRKLPLDGAPVCVLYDPENPRRNALYPLPLVRLD
jgi:hypothetical protein